MLGYESAGIVQRVGDVVTTVEPGDHVILSYHSCGRCKPCMSSHAAHCDNVWEANFTGARLDGSNGLHVAHGAEPHSVVFVMQSPLGSPWQMVPCGNGTKLSRASATHIRRVPPPLRRLLTAIVDRADST
ncbi:alcohol dehydrogenase catalytic domain-containing protein [Streptomyces niveus]|uniref:alcohol dehydrogenase catalytic domain-containing protein n=1 Tax=Streptomyces niveus TaxID=193462 RepID=UPI001FE1069D|nr:alcohol dehydrogenase catalytic domain-containing protein [Streptomyces niveus]